MENIKFTANIITPMFMAGADRKTPELRPSEFKGMMRFWWRAIRAEDDIEKLKKEEAEIFGGTGEKEGRSKVRIMLSNHIPPNRDIGRNIKDIIGDKRGCKYLLYSTFLLRSKGQSIIRRYIKPGYEFGIKLSSFNESAYKQALSAFWLSIYLGGFGTRARRGGGNITITSINENNLHGLTFIPNAKNKKQLSEWIEENLKVIKSYIESGNTSKYTNMSNMKILVFEGKEKWIDALNWIGEKFSKYRFRNKRDLWNMAAFGMPIMHNKFSVRMVPYKNKKRLSERLASPLIIKLIKSNSKYFPVVIRLNFNPGEVGKEQRSGRKWNYADSSDIQYVNMAKVDSFINSIKNEAMEINYDQL